MGRGGEERPLETALASLRNLRACQVLVQVASAACQLDSALASLHKRERAQFMAECFIQVAEVTAQKQQQLAVAAKRDTVKAERQKKVERVLVRAHAGGLGEKVP